MLAIIFEIYLIISGFVTKDPMFFVAAGLFDVSSSVFLGLRRLKKG